MVRRRLDAELVRRRLAGSRTQAVGLIESGLVLVGGAPADKPARLVGPGEAVVLTGARPRYVGRGGEKLEAALARFAVAVTGRDVLDAGSSTGGFTDCLLQAGARRVVAVDVGRGQLHERLRRDRRVEVHERTDIRRFASESPERFELVVADLSFISLRGVAVPLADLTIPGGDLIVLVKPQFEAGRAEVSKGRGVIRDPAVWRQAVTAAINAFAAAGATNMGVMVSPLRGADGNVEFLAHFSSAPGGRSRSAGSPEVTASIDAAMDDAAGPAGN